MGTNGAIMSTGKTGLPKPAQARATLRRKAVATAQRLRRRTPPPQRRRIRHGMRSRVGRNNRATPLTWRSSGRVRGLRQREAEVTLTEAGERVARSASSTGTVGTVGCGPHTAVVEAPCGRGALSAAPASSAQGDAARGGLYTGSAMSRGPPTVAQHCRLKIHPCTRSNLAASTPPMQRLRALPRVRFRVSLRARRNARSSVQRRAAHEVARVHDQAGCQRELQRLAAVALHSSKQLVSQLLPRLLPRRAAVQLLAAGGGRARDRAGGGSRSGARPPAPC